MENGSYISDCVKTGMSAVAIVSTWPTVKASNTIPKAHKIYL